MTLALTHLYGDVASYEAGDVLGPRLLPDYELVWVIEGQADNERADGSFHIPAGSAFLATPCRRETYRWHPGDATFHGFLHFAFDAAPAHWPALEPTVCALGDDDPVKALFRYLLEQWCRAERRNQRPTAHVSCVMAAMLELLLFRGDVVAERASAYPAAVTRALRRASQRVEQHGDGDVCLDDLAKAASVSAKHLCRLFAEHVGCAPMEAVRLMRLDRALRLLARSNLSVQAVAERCGFASPFHFSRAFKQAYGRSPRAMREELHAGAPMPRCPIAQPARQITGW